MAVKSDWENGEQFNASDANAVAEAVNAAYVKPAGGVPITDLTSGVQVSLGKADTAVQSVSSTSITDSTTTGRAVITATDAAAARTTLGVEYGSTSGTVVQGNDARLSPSSTSITDSTATGRSLITAVDPAAARTTLGVAYGSTGGTVAQGNDARIVGAEQAANKGVANGYASLDGGGKVPVSQLPSSIMEYQGTFNASTGSPSLANGTGNTGDVYRVTVAGSQNFGAGSISFEVGDYVIYNGSVWEKSDTTDAVSTVAGLTGDVTASSLRGALGSGTPSSTNFLRGDGQWSTVQSGITRSISTITQTNSTVSSATNTDYVVYSNIATIPEYYTGDQYLNSNIVFAHCDGADGATTFADLAWNGSWTGYNGASLSTAEKKFGTASLYFNGSGTATPNTTNWGYYAFGTGGLTIEFFINIDSAMTTGSHKFLTFGGSHPYIGLPNFYIDGGGLYSQGWDNVGGTLSAGILTPNTWHHVAISRSGGTLRCFRDGVQQSSLTNSYSLSCSNLTFGQGPGSGRFKGYLDEIRFTKAGRYAANFTPPTQPFPETIGLVPAVPPKLNLPSAQSNSNAYHLMNVNAETLTLAPQTGQPIDGATGSITVPAGTQKRYLSDGATGWRSW